MIGAITLLIICVCMVYYGESFTFTYTDLRKISTAGYSHFSLIQIREQRTDDRGMLLQQLPRRRFLAFAVATFVLLLTFIYFLGQPPPPIKVFLPYDTQLITYIHMQNLTHIPQLLRYCMFRLHPVVIVRQLSKLESPVNIAMHSNLYTKQLQLCT